MALFLAVFWPWQALGVLEAVWGVSEASGAILEAVQGVLKASWEGLGAVLGPKIHPGPSKIEAKTVQNGVEIEGRIPTPLLGAAGKFFGAIFSNFGSSWTPS